MSLLKREQANASNSACCSYSSPIVHALSKLPDLEKAQLCVTFDLANFIAWVVSDQMLRMADHILDWLDILSYQFSQLIFNSVMGTYVYVFIVVMGTYVHVCIVVMGTYVHVCIVVMGTYVRRRMYSGYGYICTCQRLVSGHIRVV